jgi:hypothetical protein
MKTTAFSLTVALFVGAFLTVPNVSAAGACWEPDFIRGAYPGATGLIVPMYGQNGMTGILAWVPDDAFQPQGQGAWDFLGECGLLDCILETMSAACLQS